VGLTSEAVSWLSGFVGLIGCLCLLSSQQQLLPIGIGLLIFFNILDCVDGSIARTMKTENLYGRFLDSLMGWIDMGFWALIGVMVYRHPQLLCWPNPLGKGVIAWLAIGGSTCYFFILVGYIEGIFDKSLRADWDKLSGEQKTDISKKRVIGSRKVSLSFILSIVRMINHNLRVRETHYFLLVFAYWGNVIDLLLGFFLFYYFLHTIFLIIVYSFRGKQVQRESVHDK
ncbi:MAG: CDP-alcohol phosphatidyltransferase family protein, partial [Candidatus Brocadiales bacterium]|nr:CDP-alcohol phosphatidyltransferase family protein [Candidatus Brocadiales bacterium]